MKKAEGCAKFLAVLIVAALAIGPNVPFALADVYDPRRPEISKKIADMEYGVHSNKPEKVPAAALIEAGGYLPQGSPNKNSYDSGAVGFKPLPAEHLGGGTNDAQAIPSNDPYHGGPHPLPAVDPVDPGNNSGSEVQPRADVLPGNGGQNAMNPPADPAVHPDWCVGLTCNGQHLPPANPGPGTYDWSKNQSYIVGLRGIADQYGLPLADVARAMQLLSLSNGDPTKVAQFFVNLSKNPDGGMREAAGVLLAMNAIMPGSGGLVLMSLDSIPGVNGGSLAADILSSLGNKGAVVAARAGSLLGSIIRMGPNGADVVRKLLSEISQMPGGQSVVSSILSYGDMNSLLGEDFVRSLIPIKNDQPLKYEQTLIQSLGGALKESDKNLYALWTHPELGPGNFNLSPQEKADWDFLSNFKSVLLRLAQSPSTGSSSAIPYRFWPLEGLITHVAGDPVIGAFLTKFFGKNIFAGLNLNDPRTDVSKAFDRAMDDWLQTKPFEADPITHLNLTAEETSLQSQISHSSSYREVEQKIKDFFTNNHNSHDDPATQKAENTICNYLLTTLFHPETAINPSQKIDFANAMAYMNSHYNKGGEFTTDSFTKALGALVLNDSETFNMFMQSPSLRQIAGLDGLYDQAVKLAQTNIQQDILSKTHQPALLGHQPPTMYDLVFGWESVDWSTVPAGGFKTQDEWNVWHDGQSNLLIQKNKDIAAAIAGHISQWLDFQTL